jgi:hypothetical protein
MNFEQLQSQNAIQFFLTVLSIFSFCYLPCYLTFSSLFLFHLSTLFCVVFSSFSFFIFYFSLFLLSLLSEYVFVPYNIFPFLYLHLFFFSLNSKRKSTKYIVSRTSPFYSGKKSFSYFFIVIVHYLYLPSFEL